MEDPEQRRREEYLKTQEPFRRNAFKIIKTMVDWCNVTPGSRHLVDEILHSIFFLGNINKVSFSPADIVTDKELFDNLQSRYPNPFGFYLYQLPRRSPFSCVLDMVVLQKQPENEKQIMKSLQDLINTLEANFLFSATICVSQKPNSSVRHYGVSMSTTGPNAGKIVIAASTCSAWDDYVGGAVMTYYPTKTKKSYFDGTIKVPQNVRCQAFTLRSGEKIDPCRSCGNLFGLPTTQTREWVYGNCAEAESVSNLLKNEKDVKNQSKPTSDSYTPKNREEARNSVLHDLEVVLRTIQFKTWDGNFYDPQQSIL